MSMTPSMRLALLVLLSASPVAAQTSLAGAFIPGDGVRAWEGEEAWEVGGGWEASGSGEVSETDPDARSRSLTLGLTRTYESGATASLGTSLSEDPAAELRTLGAELGAEAPLGPMSLSVDLAANSYRADVVQPERVVRRRRRTVVIPSVTERMRLWELHPSATVSLPLLGGLLTPSFSTGRSFFSEDPAAVAERLYELESAPRAEEVAGQVEGFASHDGELALDVTLPAGLSLRGAAGAERTAADGAWSASRSVELAFESGPLELTAGWDRSLSYGERTDTWTAGLTLSFGGPGDDGDDEDAEGSEDGEDSEDGEPESDDTGDG